MWYSLPMGDSWPDMSVVPRNLTRTVNVPAGETTTLTFKANWFLEYYDDGVQRRDLARTTSYCDGSDQVEVQVSTDGGTTFTTLPGTMGGMANPVTGNSMGWTDATFDLTPYAGTTIKLRFLYEPDKFGDLTTGSCTIRPVWSSTISRSRAALPASIFSDGAETVDPGWEDAGWAKNWYRATKAW